MIVILLIMALLSVTFWVCVYTLIAGAVALTCIAGLEADKKNLEDKAPKK